MKYSQSDIERVKKAADIRDFVPDLKGKGATLYRECPECKVSGKNKGLVVTHKNGMDIAKCFSCGYSITGAIKAVEVFENKNFIEALQTVAQKYGILLETESEKRKRVVSSYKKQNAKSFCDTQLEASGLTVEDVTACVVSPDNPDTKIYQPTFIRGGFDHYWNINRNDDEMLILYYDLWGHKVQYSTKGIASRLKDYIRVRWSNPALHLDSSGKEIKYQTPKGAQTKFYIPEYIRSRFLAGAHIDTLIIQEGEKKAEKACKHDIPSIAIQGIYNIGNEETGLIQDLQYLVQKCSIKNVVILMDSDWDNLHKSICIGDHVDKRPNQFAKAVIKFRTYVGTMHNLGVSVDVFFAHIIENDAKDKGIDDLLVHTLKNKELDLKEDIEKTIYSHDGLGRYCNIYKVSSKTDFQIKDLWALNDKDAFLTRHKEQLQQLSHFRFQKISYRIDGDKMVQNSKIQSGEDFWAIDYDDKGRKKVNFGYLEAFRFINSNGFYRIKTVDCDVDQYKFCRIDDGVVFLSGPAEIRDFVYSYALNNVKDRDVITMFASKLGSLLGSDKLERIEMIHDDFDNFDSNIQRIYFNNGCLSITAQGMDFSENHGRVWSDRVITRKFRRIPIIERIEVINGNYYITPAQNALECEFFRYILNVSNFWHSPGYNPTQREENEYNQHVLNKITSIGYLLTDFKYQTELKAIIAMDSQLGEVGKSNGRTGKSLIGVALSKMVSQAFVDGRKTKNDDEYIYSDVTPRTRNIFIDDVRTNFDFNNFFSAITGDLSVNPKTMARFVIKNDRSPKIYITTNHAINAQDKSAQERINYMAFSDWYSDKRRPVDDFGHQFFVDWDEEQWCLFDNFMCECCMYYLRSMAMTWYRSGQGAIPPPMEDIRKRTLKQLMSEAFFQWAELYFDRNAGHINMREARKAMFDGYHAAFPNRKDEISATNFKSRILAYCEFKGYHFNIRISNDRDMTFNDFINKYPNDLFVGKQDKSGGVEYFSVSTPEYALQQPF